MKSRSGSGGKRGGDGATADAPSAGPAAGEFASFLAELSGAVAERVKAIGSKPVPQADPVFFDESKTIVEWPEISAYVIEELR